jgi:signal transduction histidine kinase
VYKFKDTGEGIKEEDLERVFEPYFTTKKNGIGLGLAITRRIVRAHGGEVILKSESGKGTEVTIKIPG